MSKTKNNKLICHHSDYIKFQFDGGKDETEKNSKYSKMKKIYYMFLFY